MPFNGDTFTRLYSWVANAANGIKIRSDFMDQDTNDIATGMTALATRVTAASAAATGALKTDANGNVGVGAAASPWTLFNAIEGAADTALASKFSVQIVSNAYSVAGVWKYTTTGGASRMVTNQGVTTFYNAASGTSGATATWTQAAQLDASGNLSLTAGVVLHNNTTGNLTLVASPTLVDSTARIELYDTAHATLPKWAVYRGDVHQWTKSGASTEVMRIDSNGNLLIHSGSTLYNSAGRGVVEIDGTNAMLALKISGGQGGYLYHDSTNLQLANFVASGGLVFSTNATSRMSISSSGVISDATAELGWKDVPVNSQGSGYTLVLADRGKQVLISTGGVTVPNAVFSAGAIITITNNSASAQTITQGTSLTMHQAGTTNTGNRTLAPWGVCSVLFIAASNCVISGNVS